MTIRQQIEQRTRDTLRMLKKCPVNLEYSRFGFKCPVVNGEGRCSGCYNPDTEQMESKCEMCKCNEYRKGEV